VRSSSQVFSSWWLGLLFVESRYLETRYNPEKCWLKAMAPTQVSIQEEVDNPFSTTLKNHNEVEFLLDPNKETRIRQIELTWELQWSLPKRGRATWEPYLVTRTSYPRRDLKLGSSISTFPTKPSWGDENP